MTKEDFYCGAFLSVLLNNGIVPALFEGNEIANRKIYDFITNEKEYRVYVKYTEKPTSCSQKRGTRLWTVKFTKAQINELKTICNKERENKVVLVCGEEKLNKSRLVVVDPDKIFGCLNVSKIDSLESQDVKVKIGKSEQYYSLYGTGRADILDGVDNTFKISTQTFFD